MSGSISLSLSQQFDSLGKPLNGGALYFYAASTTTPQSAYQDTSLTIPWPNPIILDSAGRIPPFYLADGQIKIRLTDAAGVTQVQADNLLVVGASSGSGSAPSVDATKLAATGDLKCVYGTSTLSGWVRSNGRTIGSASSGGTERANADCEELFVYLWNTDAGLAVSTGRGSTAADDWAANKNIALPDYRGRVIAGFDSMGNTAANRLTTTVMNGNGIGAVGGTETHTLTRAQIPTGITASGTNSISVSTTNFVIQSGTGTTSSATGGGSEATYSFAGGAQSVHAASTGSNSISVTSNNTSGAAHPIVQPTGFATIYIRL